MLICMFTNPWNQDTSIKLDIWNGLKGDWIRKAPLLMYMQLNFEHDKIFKNIYTWNWNYKTANIYKQSSINSQHT